MGARWIRIRGLFSEEYNADRSMNEIIYPFPSELVNITGRVIADIGCPSCGYNIRGKLLDGPCPRCGKRLLPQLVRIFDMEGNFTSDFLCSACRYDLRGLTWKHRCPECGQPAVESLRRPITEGQWHPSRRIIREVGGPLLLILTVILVFSVISYILYRYV